MGIKNNQQSVFACPKCKIPLTLNFVCSNCRTTFQSFGRHIIDFLNETDIRDQINIRNFQAQWDKTENQEVLFGFNVNDYLATYEFAFQDDLGNSKSKRIFVDVGCGTGQALYKLAEKYPNLQVIGLDLSETVIRKNLGRNIPSNLFFLRASIWNLPFITKSVDYVFCSGVLHHLADPEKGFKNLLAISNNKIYFWVYPKLNSDLYLWLRQIFPFAYKLPDSFRFLVANLFAAPIWTLQRLGVSPSYKTSAESLKVIKLRIHDNLSPEFQESYTFDALAKWFFDSRIHSATKVNELGVVIKVSQ